MLLFEYISKPVQKIFGYPEMLRDRKEKAMAHASARLPRPPLFIGLRQATKPYLRRGCSHGIGDRSKDLPLRLVQAWKIVIHNAPQTGLVIGQLLPDDVRLLVH